METVTRGFLALLFVMVFAGSSFAEHEITYWPDNKRGAVSLTFDDNCVSHYSLGIPALNERGLKGTFFVITDDIGSWDPWKNAAKMGHEIGSHTKTHPHLPMLSLPQVQDEMAGAKAAIDVQIAPDRCLTFAYPYGQLNSDVESIAQNIYIAARGVYCGLNSDPVDFYQVRACSPDDGDDIYAQTNAAEEQSKWLVIFIHSLDGGGDCWGSYTIDALTDYLGYLKTKNLWAGTFGSIVKYIKERDSAILSVVSSSSDQIVLSLTDSMGDDTYDEPLTIRSEVPSSWVYVSIQQGSSITTVKSSEDGQSTVIVATDNFNRVNANNLGANWGPNLGYSNIAISSNRATGPYSRTDHGNRYIGANFSADQYSQLRMSMIGSGKGVFVRVADSEATSYLFHVNWDSSATLYKYLAGSEMILAEYPSAGFSDGDIAKIAVRGSNPATIHVHKNGILLGMYDDLSNPIQSGRPGIYIWSNSAYAFADDWEGGNYGVGTTRTIYYNAIPNRGPIILEDATTPQIAAINPDSIIAGSAGFVLEVTGSKFASESVVRWNNSDRVTTFGSATRLQASISAADIATSGTVPVTVFNPGGGLSNAVIFEIKASQPTVTSLNPSYATTGGSSFPLTVNGSSFVSGCKVRWNGSDRPTTFISGSQLEATINSSDISVAGTATIAVLNPGGVLSNSLTFEIRNPVPSLTSLSPSSAMAGGAGFTLTVTGSNFINGSVVYWNGANRTTTYVSATQLTAAITVADIATAGTALVTVYNPAPGGGTSNAITFTIQAANPVLNSLTIYPSNVIGENSSQGTVVLSGPAPSEGAIVSLSSSNTSVATVPATVTVPSGQTSTNFTVNTAKVTGSKKVTISGSYTGVTKSATLTVQPLLASVSVSLSSVVGGTPSSATVKLNGPAPGDIVVSLSSGNTSVATVPATVTVPSGQTSTNFTVNTSKVTRRKKVTISGAYDGVTKSDTLTVMP